MTLEEFLAQYWWCFVVLAVIVSAVIVALIVGKSKIKQENAQKQNIQLDNGEQQAVASKNVVVDSNKKAEQQNENDKN